MMLPSNSLKKVNDTWTSSGWKFYLHFFLLCETVKNNKQLFWKWFKPHQYNAQRITVTNIIAANRIVSNICALNPRTAVSQLSFPDLCWPVGCGLSLNRTAAGPVSSWLYTSARRHAQRWTSSSVSIILLHRVHSHIESCHKSKSPTVD